MKTKKKKSVRHSAKKAVKIKIVKNGPYLVTGPLPFEKEIILSDKDGYAVGYKKKESYPLKDKYSLCRCGHSETMPYCDGKHSFIQFDGTETAGHKKFEDMAQKTVGPELILTDVQELCASARFCDRAGGTWHLTEVSDNPKAREIAIQEACDCPAGRLVIRNKKTGKPIECKFKKSASILEDPAAGVSGPIWLKGGVAVEDSNGKVYEIRNRVTLCRCGESANKPFCDGNHIPAGFRDGDPLDE